MLPTADATKSIYDDTARADKCITLAIVGENLSATWNKTALLFHENKFDQEKIIAFSWFDIENKITEKDRKKKQLCYADMW